MKRILLVITAICIFFAGCNANAKDIGEKKAKEIALSHAGVENADVTFVKAEADRENGKRVYEIEFYTSDHKEYDYEVDAQSGEILSYDFDAENYNFTLGGKDKNISTATQSVETSQTEQTPQKEISEKEAKEIALKKLPEANESNIREFKKDYDDGKLFYEGKIVLGETEYEFEIDASNGNVVKWEKDSLYD
ncbi:MAG: PepSY domain-containing protein [Clostridia bacterium]|nr:PepSY domain-containing protein [Clostridia bacterium]